MIAGKVVLGRSFGLVPANRGIVARGPYLLVRHPIYAGYLHHARRRSSPRIRRAWNMAVLLVADTRADRAGAHRGAGAQPGRAVSRVLQPRRLAPGAGGVLGQVAQVGQVGRVRRH